MSREEQLAILDERFIRIRNRQDVLRHRRPGEISIPGVKFTFAVAIVLGLALRLAGIGSIVTNILVVAVVTTVVTWALAILGGLLVKSDIDPGWSVKRRGRRGGSC